MKYVYLVFFRLCVGVYNKSNLIYHAIRVEGSIKNKMVGKKMVFILNWLFPHWNLMWVRTWRGWDVTSHIDELKIVCILYKYIEPFLQLSYGFGIVYPWITKRIHLVFSQMHNIFHNKPSCLANLLIWTMDMKILGEYKNKEDISPCPPILHH